MPAWPRSLGRLSLSHFSLHLANTVSGAAQAACRSGDGALSTVPQSVRGRVWRRTDQGRQSPLLVPDSEWVEGEVNICKQQWGLWESLWEEFAVNVSDLF